MHDRTGKRIYYIMIHDALLTRSIRQTIPFCRRLLPHVGDHQTHALPHFPITPGVANER